MKILADKNDRTPNSDHFGWLIANIGTPTDNQNLPIHRWYRFPACFSANLIHAILKRYGKHLNNYPVLDPFASTATASICSKIDGINSIGVEAHPLLYRIGRSKLEWGIDINEVKTQVEYFISEITSQKPVSIEIYPELVTKCFSKDVLGQLACATDTLYFLKDQIEEHVYDFLWLGFVSIIRRVSNVCTAPWQYVLPSKKNNNKENVLVALRKQYSRMVSDLEYVQCHYYRSWGESTFTFGDARKLEFIPDSSIGLGICSPPYLNNFDYSDATRLETYVLRETNSWKDISKTTRSRLVVSSTTQVGRPGFDPYHILRNLDSSIFSSVIQPIEELTEVRKDRGGRKNYDVMVAHYFHDMHEVLREMARVLIKGNLFILIIGDSAPYGVYIPTDNILGEMAITSGFSRYYIVKLRDRNIRWNNRKHQVPLRESALLLIR